MSNTTDIAALKTWQRAHTAEHAKGVIHAHPVPVPPVTGIPPIPAGQGKVLRKDFADGTLAPFNVLTYPNDHPGDLMIQYGTFAASQVTVHDGYLDLRCTRSGAGWLQGFVGTFVADGGPTRTFDFQYGTVRWMARMNTGKGAWQGCWLLNPWRAPEIDWPEQIGGRLTANIHGSSADGQKASIPVDTGWHEYGVVRTPTYTAFLYDGIEVGRTVAMPARMALLADAKVGLSAPDATTPELFLNVAWVTVDS